MLFKKTTVPIKLRYDSFFMKSLSIINTILSIPITFSHKTIFPVLDAKENSFVI